MAKAERDRLICGMMGPQQHFGGGAGSRAVEMSRTRPAPAPAAREG
ncbi:hypothetical protein KPATCC21470_1623 [Kitasatospora purpeofusca]